MKYTPKYKIKSVKFTHKGNEFNVDGSKVITGIYEYEKGGRLADYTYIPKNNVKEFITDNGVIKSHSNGVWVLSSELVKTVKKPAPKRVVKRTPTKRGAMMPPSEKYKGVKNMPLDVFKLAENIVAMKKAKAKAKDIRSMADLLSYEFKHNKDFNSWHEPLAYTALWFNSSIPLSFSIQILGNEDYYGEGLAKAFREQFVEAPDVSVNVKKINTGNFMSNKAEQDLVKSFAGKDLIRPQLNEIYLDDGYAVATNAHILLAIYDKKLLKKDEYFNATKVNTLSPYPKWRGVIPTNSLKTQKINAQELLDFINKVIKYGATNPTTKGVILKLGDNNYGFNINYFSQSLKAMMQLSKDDIYVHFTDGSTNRAVLLTHIENWGLNKPDSTFALIMPIMVMDTFKDYIRYDVNDDKVFAKGGQVNNYDDDVKFERFKIDLINYSDYYELGDGYSSRYKGMKNKKGDISTGEYLIEGNEITWNYVDKNGKEYSSLEIPKQIIDLRDYVSVGNNNFEYGGELDSDEIIETIWESNNTGRFIETKDGLKTRDSFASFVKKNDPNYTADAIFDSNVYNGVIAVGSSKMDREEFRDYVAKAKKKKSRRWFSDGGRIDTSIAMTILQQLGGQRKLQMFTGAHSFVALRNGVVFKIKNRSINNVMITLNANDLYDLYFSKTSGVKMTNVKEFKNIYNDQLIEIFEDATGMYLRFAKGGEVKKKNTNRGANMLLAKEIRKEGEAWKDALKRAGQMLKNK